MPNGTTTPGDLVVGYLTRPQITYKSQYAKRKKRKKCPNCALCGIGPKFLGRSNDVHHIISVSDALKRGRPELCWDEENLETLCRTHHFIVAHLRNWKTTNPNLEETIDGLQVVYSAFLKAGRL